MSYSSQQILWNRVRTSSSRFSYWDKNTLPLITYIFNIFEIIFEGCSSWEISFYSGSLYWESFSWRNYFSQKSFSTWNNSLFILSYIYLYIYLAKYTHNEIFYSGNNPMTNDFLLGKHCSSLEALSWVQEPYGNTLKFSPLWLCSLLFFNALEHEDSYCWLQIKRTWPYLLIRAFCLGTQKESSTYLIYSKKNGDMGSDHLNHLANLLITRE